MTPLFRRRVFLVFSAALLTGCSKPSEPADTTPPSPVEWKPAALAAPGEWTQLVGVTQPLPGDVARVTAAIDGHVSTLLQHPWWLWVKTLHEGDLVAAGEEIAHLDDRISRLNLEKAESAAKSAAEDIAQAQTALGLATYALAQKKALRDKAPTSVPDIDLRMAEGAESDAKSKLLAAQERQVQAKKEVAALRMQVQLSSLTAPIRGRLGRVQTTLGQTLAVGAEVAEIVNIEDQIDVLCFVSQREAAGLQVGQEAGLGDFDQKESQKTGEAWSPEGWGEVVYVSDKAEPETGSFVVKVRFPNKNPHLRGNVVQRLRVQTRPGEEQLSIPESALIEDRDPPTVVIATDVKTQLNDEKKEEQVGTAQRMQAIINVRDGELKIVGLRGLLDSEGKAYTEPLDKVLFVTQGAQGLQSGDAVRLQQKEAD